VGQKSFLDDEVDVVDKVESCNVFDVALNGKAMAIIALDVIELNLEGLLESRGLRHCGKVLGEVDNGFRGDSIAGGESTGSGGFVDASS
jgi:hypothetical protein